MVREVDGSWTCNQCSFNSPYATTMTNHVEARHLRSTDGYSCQLCGKHCPTKNALKCHTYRVHGGQKNTMQWHHKLHTLSLSWKCMKYNISLSPFFWWIINLINYLTFILTTLIVQPTTSRLVSFAFQTLIQRYNPESWKIQMVSCVVETVALSRSIVKASPDT